MADPLPDILTSGLSVVFCGLNPGMEAATSGHHFVGRGNRFWKVIHQAGFTPTEIMPRNDTSILSFGCGLTTVVSRPTPGADEIANQEFRTGGQVLRQKMEHYAPRNIAFLGKAAFAAIMNRRDVTWGRQPETIGTTAIWVLPNPSGRNLGFSLTELVEAYSQLYRERNTG